MMDGKVMVKAPPVVSVKYFTFALTLAAEVNNSYLAFETSKPP